DGTTTENSSGTNYESHTFSVSTNGEETSYTYNIYVRDGNGCTVRENVEITQPTLLTATIDPDDIVKTCTDQSVGAATVTPAGGTQGTSPDPAYTYAWNTYPTASWGTNRTTQTISDLPEGSYRVTVTDAHGCEATTTVTIGARPVPNFTLSVDGDDSKCYYDRETEIVVSNGGTGSTYAWSASATEAGLPAGSDGATVTVTPTAANTYTYNVTITAANACVVTASVPLTIYPVPTVEAPSSGIVEATCYGYDDGSFTLVATGGTIFSDGPTATPYYYQFSIDGGTEENFYSNVNSQVQHTIDGQTAGTYNVVVTDFNGCTASVTGGVEVWQPTAVTATIDPDNDIIETCDGQSVGEATVTPGGGRPGTAPAPAYTYAWNTYPTATWDPARTTQAISDLPEGSYSVTVTDGYGCIGSTTVAIGARQVPSINATSTLNDVCLSASTSTLSVLNNNTLSIASHSWSVTPTDGAGMPADNTTASLTVTPTASATAAVTYTYTDVVTAENGCVVSGDVVLTVNPTAILDHTSGDLDQTLCFEKTLVPIVFEYSGGATGIDLTWTDGTPATTCLDFAIDNTAHTLTISEGSAPVAGTYAYTVATTGAISPCDNPTLSGTIIIRPELTVSVTGDHQSCVTGNIGVATAHPVGGKPFGTAPDTYYNYLWSNTETTATIDELEGGITYRVTVTDANSCTAINSVAIVKNTNPEIEIADVETVCPAAGSITVSAEITTETSPDYIYRWTNDGSFAVTTTNPLTTTATSVTATVSVPNASCSQDYTLKLQVEDANNCLSNIAEKAVTVADITTPTISPNVTDYPAIPVTNCKYKVPDVTGLVTVNDECVRTSLSVTQNPPAGTVISSTQDVTITVSDGCEHSNSTTISVVVPNDVSASIEVTTQATGNCPIASGEDYEVASTVAGGTSPYTYSWTNATAVENHTDQATFESDGRCHTYNIRLSVNDSYGCVSTTSVEFATVDNTKPTITCPSNISVDTDLGANTAAVTVPLPTNITDNCAVDYYRNNYTNAENASATYNLGITTVTYTVYDMCGNDKTCTFTVTVTDTEPPCIGCDP
ncbi:MAG: HYR domain-containing protein, partial [Bacteroidales bacterium]|nr:HYR domain-containing protein [Bacteroidales bacterium]